jgi:hypothetical protein
LEDESKPILREREPVLEIEPTAHSKDREKKGYTGLCRVTTD